MIEVRLARSAKDVEQCLRLRWTVFVEEQGVRPSLELDGLDSEAEPLHPVVGPGKGHHLALEQSFE